jgi:hypothetical protein
MATYVATDGVGAALVRATGRTAEARIARAAVLAAKELGLVSKFEEDWWIAAQPELVTEHEYWVWCPLYELDPPGRWYVGGVWVTRVGSHPVSGSPEVGTYRVSTYDGSVSVTARGRSPAERTERAAILGARALGCAAEHETIIAARMTSHGHREDGVPFAIYARELWRLRDLGDVLVERA